MARLNLTGQAQETRQRSPGELTLNGATDELGMAMDAIAGAVLGPLIPKYRK